MITIKVPPHLVIKGVYDRSQPQGLGFTSFTPGEMSEEDAVKILRGRLRVEEGEELPQSGSVSLDYLLGRACKFHFKFDEHGCHIEDGMWYDHTLTQLKDLVDFLKSKEQ